MYEVDTDAPYPGPPKRGRRFNAEFVRLDQLAIADINAGLFQSTLEAAKAYVIKYYPIRYYDRELYQRQVQAKYINGRLRKILAS